MYKASAARSVINRFVILCLAAVFFGGCTSSVPAYQEMSHDGGFNSLPLGNDTYKVIFKGREGSDKGQVRDYALLRSAEISRDAGFKHFVVLKELAADWITKDKIHATPATRDTVQEMGANGRLITRTVTTPAIPGLTVDILVPVCTLTIKMLHSASEGSNSANPVFDSAATIAKIKSKHQVK